MTRTKVITVLLIFFCASILDAKRGAPKKVAPIVKDNIEYSAPHDQMGFVVAHKGMKVIWRRQIYVVKFDPNLERDVQDVFINSMQLEGNILKITNEKKSTYQLNLTTLEVEVLQGSFSQ